MSWMLRAGASLAEFGYEARGGLKRDWPEVHLNPGPILRSNSAREVAPIVLEDPSDNRDRNDRQREVGKPEVSADAQTYDEEPRAEREENRPPTPWAELAQFGVTIIDIAVELILDELTTLLSARQGEVRRDESGQPGGEKHGSRPGPLDATVTDQIPDGVDSRDDDEIGAEDPEEDDA